MPQLGGKPKKSSKETSKKSSKKSSDSKRHFTVVLEGKEHGLYVSSTPSSAAKKAVTKLCASNKKKKVEFCVREITQGSKKKTYGPYLGYIEKLKEPIELKGRVVKYKSVAKLIDKKKMKGGFFNKTFWEDIVGAPVRGFFEDTGSQIKGFAENAGSEIKKTFEQDIPQGLQTVGDQIKNTLTTN